MIYSINSRENKKLSQFFDQAMKELCDFYEVNWDENTPNLFLVPDRKTINNLRGYPTESWVVGWSENNNVFLLNKKNFSKESQHKYSPKEYYKLLKHELSHCFYRNVFTYSNNPIWLNEGLAQYLSGMNDKAVSDSEFKSFLKFHDSSSAETYTESGLVVELIVTKFGKEKILDLVRGVRENNTEVGFSKLFKEIYSFELNYQNINNLVT